LSVLPKVAYLEYRALWRVHVRGPWPQFSFSGPRIKMRQTNFSWQLIAGYSSGAHRLSTRFL
ncbi:MAG: hypothetical protein SPG61_04275, partial [Arcanobacterium sp.]|nr:hypothetical protein [Arcanobacterium sp.]